MSDTASEMAKRLGLSSLKQAVDLSGESRQTLNNWFNHKPFLFKSVINETVRELAKSQQININEFSIFVRTKNGELEQYIRLGYLVEKGIDIDKL